MWHVLHTDVGSICLCNWYRSDFLEHDQFINLHSELDVYAKDAYAVFMAGDLNVHHKKWLHFSNGNTAIGQELQDTCKEFGLIQYVRHPTRNDYLLDLVLCDLSGIKCSVEHSIADHRATLSCIPMPLKAVQSETSRLDL